MSEIHTDPLSPENVSPGRTLAAARQARGLSVEDVAQRLKFSARQIQALEADDYASLPGSAIVRGMIRTYSRLLELDAAALVGDLQRRITPDAIALEQKTMHVPMPATGSRRGAYVYVLLSVLVVVACGAVLLDWVLREREAAVEARVQTETKQAARTPAVSAPNEPAAPTVAEAQPEPPPPAVAAAAAGLGRIDLAFERDSWVEIKDAEGTVLVSALNRAGSSRAVEGKPPFALVIGNASGVRLRYNDADVNLAPHTRVDVARLSLE